MNPGARRIVGYGSGLCVAGALLYVGFVLSRNVDAEVDTLLGSAEVQLRLASSMPAKHKDGKPVAARQQLLAAVRDLLDRADNQRLGYLPSQELRAHLYYMEGRYRDAAQLFGTMSDHQDATTEQRDLFVLNRSRMLRAAGDASAAKRALDAHQDRFLSKNSSKSRIERANILADLGSRSEAVRLVQDLAVDSKDPMVLMESGFLLEEWDQLAAADSAYQKAAADRPLANYYRARLKVRSRDYDTGVDLLERALRAAGRQVRVLLRRDKDAWTPCANNPRFRDLTKPVEKAAPTGR